MSEIEQKNEPLMPMKECPGEMISRGCTGELLPPLNLPVDLALLYQDWEPLTYEQQLADAKKRPAAECLLILRSVGGVCRTAVEVVRRFRPLIERCRDEFNQPGRRVPVQGRPTWTEFVRATFGCTPRRMQQLLADGSPSKAAASVHSKETKAIAKARSQEPAASMMDLAVRLAREVVEQGFAERFPTAIEILDIVDSKESPRPLPSGNPANGSHADAQALQVSPPSARQLAVNTEDTIRPASTRRGKFQPQPDCFICGTGINTCTLHAPQLAALMAKGKDEYDASLSLRDQFAREQRLEARG